MLNNRDAVLSYIVSILQQILSKLSTGFEAEKYFTRARDFEKLFWACSTVLFKEQYLTGFFDIAVRSQNQSGFVTYPEVPLLIDIFDNFFLLDSEDRRDITQLKNYVKSKVKSAISAEISNDAKQKKLNKTMENMIDEQKVQFNEFVSFIREYAVITKAENQKELTQSARSLSNRISEIKRLLNKESGIDIEVEESRGRKFIKFKFPTEDNENNQHLMEEE